MRIAQLLSNSTTTDEAVLPTENVSSEGTESSFPNPINDETYSGIIGDCTWTLKTLSGLLFVLGNGELPNYSSASSYPWYKYREYVKSIIIGYGVTSIGAYAFSGCKNVSGTIQIPNSVSIIHYSAFELTNPQKMVLPFLGCSRNPGGIDGYLNSLFTNNALNPENTPTNLIEVEVTDSYRIPESAFRYMNSIKKITLNNEIETIGVSAFSGLENLEEINIPKSLKSIETYAFKGCKKITSIDFPSTLESIGEYAFMDCILLKGIHLKNGLNRVGCSAFKNCKSATIVEFPSTLKDINNNAFQNCERLEKIIIPEGVVRIGNEAFCNCTSVDRIEIPKTIETIGYSVFELTNPRKMTLPFIGRSRDSEGLDGYLNSLFTYYALNTDNLPTNLMEVEVTDSYRIPESAFRYMNSIKKITLNNEIETIGVSAFSGLENLEEINIPKSLKSIETYAFKDCKKITSIDFPSTFESIGEYAFVGCNSLLEVLIPENVDEIKDKAFGYIDYTTKMNDFTIFGYKGSAACDYANDNCIIFIDMEEFSNVILGDADGDGEIAAIDVTQIMRSCAHISTGIDKDVMMNADVDGNGLLEITDATYIQRYLARQQTPYAIGQKK